MVPGPETRAERRMERFSPDTGRRTGSPSGRGLGVSLVIVFAACLMGCPGHGVIDDGTSISYGPSNHGTLMRPAMLPVRGEGYEIPTRWRRRGLRYGTDELVSFIVHTGRRVRATMPRSTLQVADLSPRRGGPSRWHRSHQTGRDVDLLFFVVNHKGRRVEPDDMIHFSADGSARLGDDDASDDAASDSPDTPAGDAAGDAADGASGDSGGEQDALYFDVPRNWTLVRELIANPVADVQYIFIYDPLAQLMLDHARSIGEPDGLIAQAGELLRQPGDSAPHDDHMHVRIYCDATDRVVGCLDRGSLRWTKKDAKYGPGRREASRSSVAAGLQRALLAPMPAMMALGRFPHMP